jgi:hypothetical protein
LLVAVALVEERRSGQRNTIHNTIHISPLRRKTTIFPVPLSPSSSCPASTPSIVVPTRRARMGEKADAWRKVWRIIAEAKTQYRATRMGK